MIWDGYKYFRLGYGNTPWDAFNYIHDPLRLQWGDCPECKGYGYTYSKNLVAFEGLSQGSEVNNIIHEFGHVFDWLVYSHDTEDQPRMKINRYTYFNQFRRPLGSSINDDSYYGLGGPRNQVKWHQNPIGAPHEEFADTYLAWIFGKWEIKDGSLTDQAKWRLDFMEEGMSRWLNILH